VVSIWDSANPVSIAPFPPVVTPPSVIVLREHRVAGRRRTRTLAYTLLRGRVALPYTAVRARRACGFLIDGHLGIVVTIPLGKGGFQPVTQARVPLSGTGYSLWFGFVLMSVAGR
jgi:hypothetical protein